MPAVRRALAALPVALLAMAVQSAQAAEVRTLPCIPYVAGQQTMPVAASGFTPNGLVTLYTSTANRPAPRILTAARLDALGGFLSVPAGQAAAGVTPHQLPPPFAPRNRNLQTFTLLAEDRSDPAAPILASSTFQVVRFGMTRSPSPKRPRQTVTYTARGFLPGRPVYAHFRFRGATRRTVGLGIAQGPCGITSRRMRALPTKVRYGTWRAYIDQSKRFSVKTRPQWIDPFVITRRTR